MRKSLRVSLATAALVLVGCGGSGSYTFQPPSVTGSTSTPTSSSTASTTVPVATDPTTGLTVAQSTPATYVDPTTGHTVTTTVTVPAGETLTAGEPTAIIPLDFPVDFTQGSSSALAASLAKQKTARLGGTTPGELFISRDGGLTWNDTRLNINGGKIHGALGNKYLALAARGTSLDISVDGPFYLGSGSNVLDVTTELDIHYDKFGVNSHPIATQYTLPADNGRLTSSKISVFFPIQFNTSGGGEAEVAYGAVDKLMSANIFSDHLVYSDPNLDLPADSIPSTGVDVVAFSLDVTTTKKHHHHP